MNQQQGERKSVFATPWFQIFAEQPAAGGQPHYVIQGKDFVVIVADRFILLANLSPSVARFTNRMWCFFAADARPVTGARPQGEAGVGLVLYEGGVNGLLDEKDFYSAPSCAALYLAALRGHLPTARPRSRKP